MATQQELAEHLDLSERQIRELQKGGAFRLGATLDEARTAYIRRLREQAAGRMSSSGLDLTAERARLAAAQARKVERENEVAEGELIPIKDVVQGLSEVISTAKSKLLVLPGRLSAKLAKVRAIKEIEKLLLDAIYEVLAELSRWNPHEDTDEEPQPEGEEGD